MVLKVDSYEGFVLGYEAEMYPDELKPVMVHFIFDSEFWFQLWLYSRADSKQTFDGQDS